MKHFKAIAATVIIAGVIAVKFLMPGVGADVRSQITEMLEQDADFVAAFSELGKTLTRERSAVVTESAAASPTPAAVPDSRPQYIYVPVKTTPARESAAESAAPVPETTVSPTLPEPTPSPQEAAPEPLPAAVTTFLESQAAFSEYEIPEKVDYSYVTLPFQYEVPVCGYNSSGFGYRVHPILNTVRFHYGTDFAAYSGEKVLAFADGVVRYAGYDDSFGWHIKIDHGDGWETLYAHCSQLNVSNGQQVRSGDCIALVGATGLATGPHLHFELTRDGKYLNPEYYINGS